MSDPTEYSVAPALGGFRLTQLRLWQWLLLAQNIRAYANRHDTAWL